jgi:4-hydroxy-tetrahydrodipicolinate synthase
VIGTEKSTFGRLMTAMVTPFKDDLSLDLNAVDKIVAHLIETGTETLVVSGTTGESPTLEEDEKKVLLSRVIKAANGQAKIIMGTGSNSTNKSIDATKEAESLGADGVLVVAPYYSKPSQNGMLEHFSRICASTTLPVVLYNIPARTGVNVQVETILELSKRHKNLYALKDSTGNVDQSAEIAGRANAEFRIYSGDDYLTLPFLSIGGCGIISVASHIAGKQIAQMIEHFFAGNLDQARSLHYEWLPLFKGLFAQPNPSCSKYALSTFNLCKNNLRSPLIALDSEQKEAMDKLLKNPALAPSSFNLSSTSSTSR